MVELFKVPGQIVFGKPFLYVVYVLTYPDAQHPGGPPYILQVAGTLKNIRDVGGIASDQVSNFVHFLICL